jgi:SAM-dependent methyltransferase
MSGIDYEYRAAIPETSHPLLFPVVTGLLKDLPEGASVLDLGCGNGTFISQFRDRGWKLFGTDFSPTGIEIAQRNFSGIDFFLADSTAPAGDLIDRVARWMRSSAPR